jgi:hypothetical protein
MAGGTASRNYVRGALPLCRFAFQSARNPRRFEAEWPLARDAKRHDRIQRCLLRARRVKEARCICRPRIP